MNLRQHINQAKINSQKFHEEGYLLIKNLFSKEEIQKYRKNVFQSFEENKRNVKKPDSISYLQCDLLSQPLLRNLVTDQRILDIARVLLDEQPVYFGYSNCQIFHAKESNFPNRVFGWHKDIPNHLFGSGGVYPLIRFGIYLQDHAGKSGGLAVKSKSHNTVQYNSCKTKIIDSEVGDLVVWNMRITHSGHAPRLKRVLGSTNDNLLGLLQLHVTRRLVPNFFLQKQSEDRVAMFITYASRSSHLDRYIQYLVGERSDEMEWFKKSRFGQDVWSQTQKNGLQLLRICPEYGTPEYNEEV